MLLTDAERAALRERGLIVFEKCDKCGKLLAEVRYTRRGDPGVWCSRLCRDGAERTYGRCQGCGADLNGKRKGTIYCSRTCRMRATRKSVQDCQDIVNTPIEDKGLSGAIPAHRYPILGTQS